jgi:hypothetical protein
MRIRIRDHLAAREGLIDIRYRIKRRDELHERIVSEHDPVSADPWQSATVVWAQAMTWLRLRRASWENEGAPSRLQMITSITHVMGHTECALPRLATPGEPIC